MVVSSTLRSKYELALHCAGGLALACLDRTSPVGVIGCGMRDVRVPPSLAKDQVLQWLLRQQKKDGSWEGDGVGTVYGTAIALLILQLPYSNAPILQR